MHPVWNTPTTGLVEVSGGSVSGVDYGVWENTYEGYSSDADATQVTIDGVDISAQQIGVYVEDSPANTNHPAVTATIDDNTSIATAGGGIGVEVSGGNASATISGDNISDNGFGIEFTAGGSGSVGTTDFSGTTDNLFADLFLNSNAGTVTDAGGNTFAASGVDSSDYIVDGSAEYLDATGDTFGAVPKTDNTLGDLYGVEDKIVDGLDTPGSIYGTAGAGLVRLRADQIFLAQSAETMAAGSIQRAVDLADASPKTAGHDTINIQAGVYVGEVDIEQLVTLKGAQAGADPNPTAPAASAQTIIEPDTSDPNPYDANSVAMVYVGVSGVAIDGVTVDGSNPNLTHYVDPTTHTDVVFNGVPIDAAGGIVSYTGVGGITVQNNILENTAYDGIDFYNYVNNAATSDNTISDNLIQNLSDAYGFGVGVLLYNNFYAQVTDNVMTNLLVGVQTGNFSQANPDSSFAPEISHNQITASGVGIFFNLMYSSTSTFTVADNDIKAIDSSADAPWQGVLLTSIQSSAGVTFQDNTIDGSSAFTSASDPSTGYEVWNTPTTSSVLISGGSVSGVDYGVWENTYEGYSSDADATQVTIGGVDISANKIGVYVEDSAGNTNHPAVTATIDDNTSIATAGGGIGVDVVGGGSATIAGATISDNAVGVGIDASSSATIENSLFGVTSTPTTISDDQSANGAVGIESSGSLTVEQTSGSDTTDVALDVTGMIATTDSDGNGIEIDGGAAAIDNASLTDNTTAIKVNSDSSPVTIDQDSISGGTTGIYIAAGAGATISNTTIDDPSGDGADIFGTATVSDASISGNAVGVMIESGGTGTITSDTISGNGIGVEIAGTLVSADDNAITGNTGDGIQIESGATAVGPITGNDLSGNSGDAIDNKSTLTVDASQNYWGANTAESAVAAETHGSVDYTPWLSSGTDNATGFTGDYGTLNVGSGGAQVQSDGRINEAIGDVTSGGTINVYDGTYTEDVVISKSLTLQNASGQSAVVVQGNSSAAAVAIDSSGVTVKGLTVEGAAGQWSMTVDDGVSAIVMGSLFQGLGLGNVETSDSLNTFTGDSFIAPSTSSESGFEQYHDDESGDDVSGEITGVVANNTFDRGVYVQVSAGDYLPSIWADIQPAINAAATGDTVNVEAGTYSGDVNVNKTVELEGAQFGIAAPGRSGSESIINSPDGTTELTISASDATVSGFTIQGNMNANNVGYGVYMVPGVSGTQFLDNVVQDNIAGLALANASASDQAVIEDNLFQNNTNPGANSGSDIYADQSTSGAGGVHDVLIQDNTFTNTSFVEDSWGIGMSDTDDSAPFSDITVSGNTVTKTGRGFYFFDSTDVAVTANTVSGATHYALGLFGDVNTSTTVSQNTFNDNGDGIDVKDEVSGTVDVTGLSIHNNFLDGNTGDAVYIDATATVTTGGIAVNTNSIAGNGTAGNGAAGLKNDSSVNVDASDNWWGSANGPTTPLNTFAGPSDPTGDTVIGTDVTIAPWLADGVDSQPAVPGFQHTPASGTAPAAPSTPVLTTDSDAPANGVDNGIGTNSDDYTNVNTPILTGTSSASEAGDVVTLYDTDGVTVLGTDTVAIDGSWSIQSSLLADGAHTLTATITDGSGNQSLPSTSLVITIDTIAPAAPSTPVLTAGSDSFGAASAPDTGIGTNSDDYTNVNTPTFTGTAEAHSLVRLYSDDTEVGFVDADGSGDWSITTSALADGTHSITAKAVDLAGNVSLVSGSLSITVDTVAPAAPSTPVLTAGSDSFGAASAPDTGIGTNSDDYTNVNTPTFTGTAEANSLVRLYSDGTEVGYADANASGNWSITTSVLTDGSHSITVVAVDKAGNISDASDPLSITIDTIAPAAPSKPVLTAGSDSATLGDGITNDNAPTISGTAEAGSLVRLFAGSTEVGFTNADVNGDWSITSSTLADGTYSVTAVAVDLAGNVSPAYGILTLVIDTQSPAPTITDTTAPDQEGKPLTLDGVANDPSPSAGIANYDWHITASNGQTIADGSSQDFTFTPTDNGDYDVTYTVTDSAGNTGLATDVLHVANVAPTVGGLSLAQSGPGNTNVVLSGTISDPGMLDNGTLTVNWGDGTSMSPDIQTFSYAAGATSFTLPTHSYTANVLGGATYTISVFATDKDNDTGNTATIGAPVNYVPAGVALSDSSGGMATEGTQYTLNVGTPTILGNYQIGNYSINWGDDTSTLVTAPSGANVNTALGPVNHTYFAENPYSGPIVVSIYDTNDDLIGSRSYSLVVNPAAIHLAATNSGPINEGQGVNVTAFGVIDPSYSNIADATFSFSYTTPSGFSKTDVGTKGATTDTVFIPSSFLSTYGTDVVTVKVTEDQVGSLQGSGSKTTTVTVNDVAPVITLASTASAFAGSPFSLSGSFTDPGNDNWTISVDYNVGGMGDTGFSTPVATGKNFTLNNTYPAAGTYTAEVKISDGQDTTTASVTVTVAPATFHVVQFTPTSTGFDVTFDEAPNFAKLNLYSGGLTNPLGTPDLTVVGANGGPVQGSLVWNAATNTASFVTTDSVLAPDNYTVTLISGSSAFEDGSGNLLQGSDGTVGDNYVATFTVAPSTGPVLSLPDFARGPGQNVDVSDTPANSQTHAPADIGTADSQYLPVVVNSTSANVLAVDFELDYSTNYLTVSSVQLSADLVSDGWNLTVNNSTPGQLLVTVSGNTPLPAGQTTLVDVVASVPTSAISSYGAAALLQLNNVSFNEGRLTGAAGRAVEKVAYFGDASGLAGENASDGTFQLSGQDAALISQNVVHLASGFSAYPLTDPRIIGDVTGDGTLSGLDASFVAQDAVFLTVPQIPTIPAHAAGGSPIADPTVVIPSDVSGTRGQTVNVPVSITDTAVDLLSADLTITYNPAVVSISNSLITLGSYLQSQGWEIAKNVVTSGGNQTGTIFLSLFSSGEPLDNTAPIPLQLVNLAFSVVANAPAGVSPVDISGRLNEGQLSITPVDGSVAIKVNATGGFTISGTEGTPLASQTVATFTDPVVANEPASDYSATIDWNDPNDPSGDTTSGTVTYDSVNNDYVVTGSDYAYVDEGTYSPTVTIHDNAYPTTPDAVVTDTTTVADAALTGSSGATATGGVEGGAVATLSDATFSDANLGGSTADFSGTINWGDSVTTNFTSSAVTGSGGGVLLQFRSGRQ